MSHPARATIMLRITLVVMLMAAHAYGQQSPPYLKCFRDEGGVLHEAKDRMPESPPPTIQIPPPPPPSTTTTTLPSYSFNYTPQLFWKLNCPGGVFWGPFTSSDQCIATRGWLTLMCPRKRVDTKDGFKSLDEIRLFREGCGDHNGVQCSCQPEYH